MRIIIISAIAQNGVIGKAKGEMSWYVKEEFKHFKNTTFGFPIVMGRRTFETLGKPLKGRENIIVSRNKNLKYDYDEVKIFDSLQKIIEHCRSENNDKIFIIGGGEIYKQTLPVADEMILSFMKFDAEGDVYFPEIKENDWKVVSREDREQFEIVRYTRINAE